MSLATLLLFGLVAALLLLLAWALRKPKKLRESGASPNYFKETGRRHTSYLPQIRQALATADYDVLVQCGAQKALLRRVRRERRSVVLAYLSALREEFDGLLRMARVIAVLSPEVAAVQEFERLRLTIHFLWRYRLARMRVWAGFAPLPQIDGLSNLLSGFSVRLETVMKELGERAALVAEMASSPDWRSIHPA